jgi:hypothetical protein
MPEKSFVATKNTPAAPDDFTRIAGIGSGIERRLHSAGILVYRQLAGMSPSEIMDAVGSLIGLTPDRILQQDWAGQAQVLALEAHAEAPEMEEVFDPSPTSDRQHYQMFTVELLLGETNDVRRTRLVHVSNQCEKSWAGWDAERLIRAIGDLAGLKPPLPEPQAMPLEEAEIPSPVETKNKQPNWIKKDSFELKDACTRSLQSGQLAKIFRQRQLVHAQFMLNLPAQEELVETPYTYHADVFIRCLDQPKKWLSKSLVGNLSGRAPSVVEFDAEELPPGTYRIDAEVRVCDAAVEPESESSPDEIGRIASNIFWVCP